jgi:hypothetical protein
MSDTDRFYSNFIRNIKDISLMEQWTIKNDLLYIEKHPENIYTNISLSDSITYRSNADYISIAINNTYNMWRKLIINGILSSNKYIDIKINKDIINDDMISIIYRLFITHDIEYNIEYVSDDVVFYGGVNSDNNSNASPKNNKVAVCTCIFNNYDTLRPIPEIPSDICDRVDFYCFTDNPDLNINDESRWVIDTTPYHYMDTEVDIKGRISTSLSKEMGNHYNIVAKYYKTCLHRIPRLKDYSYFLYIDGSIQVKDFGFLKDCIDNKNFVLYKHPEGRYNIKQESEAGKYYKRYAQQPLSEQVESYYNEGYDAYDLYLVATGFCFRPNSYLYNTMFMTWYNEIQKWSDLCQISFPFCSWLYNIYPFMVDEYIYSSQYTLFHPHVYRY